MRNDFYGLYFFVLHWIFQRFRKLKQLAITHKVTIIGTANARASITTLERYYGVSSGTVASYLTVSQMVAMFSPVFVNIFSRSHIPRIIHISFWIKAAAFAVLIAPYFIGPKYEPILNEGNFTQSDNSQFCGVRLGSKTLPFLSQLNL